MNNESLKAMGMVTVNRYHCFPKTSIPLKIRELLELKLKDEHKINIRHGSF